MDFGNINTDWVLIVTVLVCTWFLGAKIHHLMQDMVTLGLQNEKDSTQNMGELVQVLESGLLEITTTLEKINSNTDESQRHLKKLQEYVHTFWWEKDYKDKQEYAKHQREMKERNKERRLKKEGKLESNDNDGE